MRKNYFAKKFVAYSMAFAVAFSTLTVSPVFVKDAKANLNLTGIASDEKTEIKDNMFWVNNNVTNTLGDASEAKLQKTDFISRILGANSTNVKFASLTSEDSVTGAGVSYGYHNLTIDANMLFGKNVETETFTTDNGTYGAGAAGTKTNAYTNSSQVSTTPLEVKFTNGTFKTTGYTAKEWYKLDVIPVEFTTSSGIAATPTDTIKGTAYQIEKEKTFVTASPLTFNKEDMTNSDYGLYLGVTKTVTGPTSQQGKVEGAAHTTSGFDEKVTTTEYTYTLVNLFQSTDLTASAEKTVFTAQKGADTKLVVNAKNNGSRDITYSWRYGQTVLPSTSNECPISAVDGSKTGKYYCTVSDGAGKIVVPVELQIASVSQKRPTYVNVVEALNESVGGKQTLIGGTAELNSSIPANDNHKKIWLDGTNRLVLSEENNLNYDANNNSIVISDKAGDYDSTDIKCYTLTTKDYLALKSTTLQNEDGSNKTIGTLLKELSAAKTDVSKNTIKNNIRLVEEENATGLNPLSSKAIYTEEFKLVTVAEAKNIKSVNVIKKMGESVSLEAAKVTDGCAQCKYNLETKNITSLTPEDFTHYELKATVEECAKETGKHTTGTVVGKTYYNVIYLSDLKATAVKDTITAKVGTNNVELEVNASSDAGLSYTWSKVVSDTIGAPETVFGTNKTNKYNIDTLKDDDIFMPAVKDELGVEKKQAYNYYKCTVTNGFETIEVPFTINQLGGYKVYLKAADASDITKQPINKAASSYPAPVEAIAGKQIQLSPFVVVGEGTTITYKWYELGDSRTVLSTTDKLIVDYKKPVSYVCVISDGISEFKLTYNVTNANINNSNVKLVVNDIEDQVFTGKEIAPELDVRILDDKGDDNSSNDVILGSKLVVGTDYTVEFVENVNVGVARVKVTPAGLYKGNTVEKSFYINRADNTLEIADKTVVLGSSVQPKTVKNTAKAALSYAYFTDAECANEIEVPSKVGTYYVKATSAATLNYKEATSNVATVKVVPGKVKMLGTSRTASSVKLNWTKATGATSYRVYYKAPGAKSYKVFKNTTATSMNVTGLASATTYTFAVKAYAKTAGYSTVYATKITTTAPAKVSTPSVTAGSKKATVKFTKVARATGYQIYMAKGNGKYVKVKTTTSTSFTKTGLAKGATYKFKVRAYKTVGSNTYYGAFSSAKAVKVK